MARTRTTAKEETEEAPLEGQVQYVKIGGSEFTLQHPTRVYKKGIPFWAFPYEIPKAFRDIVVPVTETIAHLHENEKAREKRIEETALTSAKYEMKERTIGWWDVLNAEGTIMNEQALRKEAAKELLESLQ